jgi:hypothetical protein
MKRFAAFPLPCPLNKLPRRKQRGIVEGNPLIISPQGAGNLPVEIPITFQCPPLSGPIRFINSDFFNVIKFFFTALSVMLSNTESSAWSTPDYP